MKIIYRLMSSETESELAGVYLDARGYYRLVPGPSADLDYLVGEQAFIRSYATDKEAFEALGEHFARVPVHVVNGYDNSRK